MYGAGFGVTLALTSWVLFTVLNPYLLECKIEVKQAKLVYTSNNACDEYQTYESEEECHEQTSCGGGKYQRPCQKNAQNTKNMKNVTKLTDEEKEKWCCPNTCGQNLVHLMENWRGTCFGSCHCAHFVSTILYESGCDGIFTTSCATLTAKLKSEKFQEMGWKYFEGNEGIQAGDVVFKGKNGKAQHVEIAVSSSRTMGANVGYVNPSYNYMSACTNSPICLKYFHQPSLLENDRYACADCEPPVEKSYFTQVEEGPSSARHCKASEHPLCKAPACENNQCVSDSAGTKAVIWYFRPPL
jgi:hypothetical protein